MRKGKARVIDLGAGGYGGAGGFKEGLHEENLPQHVTQDDVVMFQAESAELVDAATKLESAVDLETFEYPDSPREHSDCDVFQVSTTNADPTSLAGEGDQGGWNSCGIFATCGALKDYLYDYFELDLGDVDSMARLVVSHNITNHAGRPVHDEGTTVQDLIDKFNSINLLWPVTDARGKLVLIKFHVKFRSFDTPRDMSEAGQPLRYGMVRGTRVDRKGAHGSHLMHAVSFQDGAIMCCNSWGSQHRDVLVPGDLYSTFGRGYLLTIDHVQIKRGAESEWELARPLPWLRRHEWGPWKRRHLSPLEKLLQKYQRAKDAKDKRAMETTKYEYKLAVRDVRATLAGLSFEAKYRKSSRLRHERENYEHFKRAIRKLEEAVCELVEPAK
eukprot:TRINITY_DN107834_c0_g1_i1.p1 TRINITY_DN107834_c0_g1~~TRINITY_DN107834_c0_g1_i1.p1  ORF type:complete len:403 (+),score=47.88 TRINITY_DN107834_c0_g1_i1:54-1211(+)